MLNEDYDLIKKDDKIFIVCNGYNIPITTHTAVLIALLDGTRTIEEAVDVMIDIELLSNELKSQFTDYFLNHYAVFLREGNNHRAYDIRDFLIPGKQVVRISDYEVPRAIMYQVTNKCDKSCVYCYFAAERGGVEKDVLTFDKICEIIDEAARMGVYKITYSGGEPFLRKDLIDIIEYVSSKSIKNFASTKYYLSEDQIIRLKKTNLYLGLSYDCHINDICTNLIGVKGYAKKMDEMIKLLVKHGIDFCVQPLVTSITFDYFEDFVLHLKSLGVSDIVVNRYVNPLGKNDGLLNVSDSQWENILNIVSEFRLSLFVDNCFSGAVPEETQYDICCVNMRDTIVIAPDGEVVLCNCIPRQQMMEYRIGDLKKNSIAQIWFSKEKYYYTEPSREQYSGHLCCDCVDFHKCHLKAACYKQALSRNGNVLAPSRVTEELCVKYREAALNAR